MKYYIIISMSILCFIPTLAQEDYESLLSESKVWTMMIKPNVNPEKYGDLRYINETKLIGDTVINGIHFMQKYERQCKQGEEMPTEWSATQEYLGYDGSKVYLYSSITDKMILDMDFSLIDGDILGCYDLFSYSDLLYNNVVTAVSDTVLDCSTDKVRRKCVYVHEEGRPLDNPLFTDVWIEGIGSLNYGISGVWRNMAVGAYEYMIKCTDRDAVIYQNDIPLGIQTKLLYKTDSNVIYNLQGRQIFSLPSKGIYVQNGKKIIVK